MGDTLYNDERSVTDMFQVFFYFTHGQRSVHSMWSHCQGLSLSGDTTIDYIDAINCRKMNFSQNVQRAQVPVVIGGSTHLTNACCKPAYRRPSASRSVPIEWCAKRETCCRRLGGPAHRPDYPWVQRYRRRTGHRQPGPKETKFYTWYRVLLSSEVRQLMFSMKQQRTEN